MCSLSFISVDAIHAITMYTTELTMCIYVHSKNVFIEHMHPMLQRN